MPPNLPARALLTGATGFIGSHLARRLTHLGCATHAIIRPHSNAADLRAMLGDNRLHAHDGTTADMLRIVQSTKPDVIFHLASLFLAQHRPQDVTALIRSNVEFGAQLAEAAAVHHVSHFVNTGTAWQHYADAPYNPANLYAATKQALADILRFYAETAALRVTHLELFDTYGPGDARPKLFAALRKAAATGETLAMSGGEQLMDLVYIEDVVEAYVVAAGCPAAALSRDSGCNVQNHVFAVSAGHPRSLREVVEMWQRVTGQSLHVAWGARPYRAREVMRPWSGGRRLPGWSAAVSLEEGMGRMEGLGTVADAPVRRDGNAPDTDHQDSEPAR